ncbi:MAG TPA: hypothetical protein VKI18_03455 [Albitalea sp.]|nr:hypothetical protein [Albitalea sp.]
MVLRLTSAKRLRAKLQAVKIELRRRIFRINDSTDHGRSNFAVLRLRRVHQDRRAAFSSTPLNPN